jgi:MFS family permease
MLGDKIVPMKRRLLSGIGINILLLGVVSLLTDVSSEMMMPILPMFITALGGTAFVVGLIGGLGDSIASILKVFSGYWSDRYGRRKPFVFSGYLVSAVSKLLLGLSTMWQHVLILRSTERVGKGVRDAPRDAIIADSSLNEVRGKAFGIHQAMDTTGAIGGSLLAFVLFWLLGLQFKTIILACAVIAFFALIPFYWVKEVRREPQKTSLGISFRTLPKDLKWFVLIASVFALGNFTYMFFILRAQDSFSGVFSERLAVGIPILLYVLYNVVYALFSIPAGMLSDRVGRGRVLLLGYSLFGLTSLGFAFFHSLTSFIILFALYGLVYALVEGTERALVSDLAPEEIRGTALGTFHTCIGLVALPAGLIAGALWEYITPGATFVYGGILGLTAAVLLKVWLR